MTNGAMTRGQLEAYIAANSFQRAQGRIGVDVYRDKPGRRATRELTVSADVGAVNLYDLKRGRRRVQSWSLA
jgi:hypothetical protein